MPVFGPISRRDLIAAFRRLGFSGPIAGGRHEFMLAADGRRLILPNPHRGDISRNLVGQLLRQVQVSREEWENV